MKKTCIGIITSLAVLAQICAVESIHKAEEKAAETPNASNNDKPQATPVKPVINRFK